MRQEEDSEVPCRVRVPKADVVAGVMFGNSTVVLYMKESIGNQQ
jgi:hypothetical protein